MVYSPPREHASLALAKQRQRDMHDAYRAAVSALTADQREAVEAYVAAVRMEAGARRISARDGERGAR
ncbi:hypothetical protein AB0P19_06685 [Microbacterium oleivorans]|uniref:hypothetical protein n=1 Tax=Microbacterium oleivorans TaxID=273677 RepID=UPI0033CB19C5